MDSKIKNIIIGGIILVFGIFLLLLSLVCVALYSFTSPWITIVSVTLFMIIGLIGFALVYGLYKINNNPDTKIKNMIIGGIMFVFGIFLLLLSPMWTVRYFELMLVTIVIAILFMVIGLLFVLYNFYNIIKSKN